MLKKSVLLLMIVVFLGISSFAYAEIIPLPGTINYQSDNKYCAYVKYVSKDKNEITKAYSEIDAAVKKMINGKILFSSLDSNQGIIFTKYTLTVVFRGTTESVLDFLTNTTKFTGDVIGTKINAKVQFMMVSGGAHSSNNVLFSTVKEFKNIEEALETMGSMTIAQYWELGQTIKPYAAADIRNGVWVLLTDTHGITIKYTIHGCFPGRRILTQADIDGYTNSLQSTVPLIAVIK